MTEPKDDGAPPERLSSVDEGWDGSVDGTTDDDSPRAPGDKDESTRSLDSDELAALVRSGKPRQSIGLRTGADAAKEPREAKADKPPVTDDLGAAFDDLVSPGPAPTDSPVRYTPSPDPVPFPFGPAPDPPVAAFAPDPPRAPDPPAPRVDSLTAPIDVSPPAAEPALPAPDPAAAPAPARAPAKGPFRGETGEVKPIVAIAVGVATAAFVIGVALFVKKVLLKPTTGASADAPPASVVEADARAALGRFGEGLKACVPTIGWLPGTSPSVPAAMDVGGVYSIDPKDWKTPVWSCTRFSSPSPQRFMMQWQQLKLNTEGMAVAWVDLDGDSKPDEAYGLRATLRKKGEVEVGEVEKLATVPPVLKQR